MARLTLTGKRVEQLAYYRALLRQKAIDSPSYQQQKEKLLRQEAGIQKRQEKAMQKAEAKAAEKARLKAIESQRKALERKETAKFNRQYKKNVLFRGSINSEEDLVNLWKSLRGKEVRFVSPDNDTFISVADKYKEFRFDFETRVLNKGGSDSDISVDALTIVQPTNLSALRIRQSFRDGSAHHCVFNPLIMKLEDALENSQSKSTIQRVRSRIAKLKQLEVQWKAGVPEEHMEDVARASGFNIRINDAFNKTIYSYYPNGKSIVSFTNLRQNHLDLGGMVLDEVGVELSEEEMMSLWKQVDTKWKTEKEFYMMAGSPNKRIRRLYTQNGTFSLFNPEKEHFDKQNEFIGLKNYRLNATKFPDVNDFIYEGRIINSWVCELGSEDATGHVDMPKAYAQFKKCHMYNGFLGMIHQWRSGSFSLEFIKEHIGIYRFRLLSCSNPLLSKLGLEAGKEYTLPSVELLYFSTLGCSMEITSGVWGSKIDFEFLPELLEDKRYARWSGKLSTAFQDNSYTFPCDEEWASHLKSTYNTSHWNDLEMATVKIPKKNVFTSHHILAFITSYVRIQMMEAMKGFELDQLVKVVMDGIYYHGPRPGSVDGFIEKQLKDHYTGFGWYEPLKEWKCPWNPLMYAKNTLLTGQGGAGKTYSILTDKCYHSTLFVSPQHVLGMDIKKQYQTNYTTINKLIGADCRPFKDESYYPPTLLIDEITQIPADWIERVLKLYPESLILLAGDINSKGQWFQCRSGDGREFSPMWKPHDVDVVCIEGDRRSRDSELKDLKLQIRSVMESIFENGDSGEEVLMRSWAKDNLKILEFSEAVSMFKNGDTWIAGTHKTSHKLLDAGIVSGYYKKGGYISDIPMEGYEKRGSFTIHSYQGKTITDGKIFISIGDCFEYAMLYTAVSRAVHFEQLVFVN